jgi:hypothetical protein
VVNDGRLVDRSQAARLRRLLPADVRAKRAELRPLLVREWHTCVF